MKTYKINLYSFDELSESSKRVVIDKERESQYNFAYLSMESDAEERISTLNKFCELFNITYRIDYDHQHRFISWDFQYSGDEELGERVGKYVWRYLNNHYYAIRKHKYFIKQRYDKNGKFDYKIRYSKVMWIEGDCPFTGMCYDEDILQPIFDWYRKPNMNISIHDLLQECFDNFMRCWESEDDYRMSDEHLEDMISANWCDKLFYSNGEEFEGDIDELETLQSLSDEE